MVMTPGCGRGLRLCAADSGDLRLRVADSGDLRLPGLHSGGLGPLVLGQVLRLVLVPDLAADSGCLGLLGLYSGGRGLDGSGLGPLVLGQVLRLVPLLGVDSDGLGQRGLISGLGLQRLTAGLLDRI